METGMIPTFITLIMKTTSIAAFVSAAVFLTAEAENVSLKAWTDPETALREDPDFAVQGEYAAAGIGAQVIAHGGGKFAAYLLDGGLPGAGWDPGKSRTPLKGARDGEQVVLSGGDITATIQD